MALLRQDRRLLNEKSGLHGAILKSVTNIETYAWLVANFMQGGIHKK